MASLLVVQHADEAPPGVLGEWAAERGLALRIVRPDRGEALPDPERFPAAVVLGSTEDAVAGSREWIDRELEWLRYVDDSGTPVLGICFGAEALAVVLGGGRRRAARPEVGWIDVNGERGWDIPPGPWLAWHHDVIEPPPGAEILARNRFGVQAFRSGPHLGVQFHPEATANEVAAWAVVGADDLDASGIDRDRLAARTVAAAPQAARAARRLFDAFWVSVSGSALAPASAAGGCPA